MLKDTAPSTLATISDSLPAPVLSKSYFFHDVRIICYTNTPAIQAILDGLLARFPVPQKIQGEVTYVVLCYESAAQFPMPLPRQRVRMDTMRLLTNTKLKYYCSSDKMIQYQRYEAFPFVNEYALSVIIPEANLAVTQLLRSEQYQATFLRRYVFLLALGQLMQVYGFEPCHAGTVTTPWGSQQGALLIGTSGSGKTTLSLGCAIAGCGLLGDDLVMLRENTTTGTIGAYAVTNEVAVRSGSIDLWSQLAFLRELPTDARDKRYCTIEQIRRGATCTYTPIRLLLFPELTTEAQSTVIPLSKAGTLQELMDKCLDKQQRSVQVQERLFVLLSKLAEQSAGYRVAIARDTNDGPRLVCSLFAGAL